MTQSRELLSEAVESASAEGAVRSENKENVSTTEADCHECGGTASNMLFQSLLSREDDGMMGDEVSRWNNRGERSKLSRLRGEERGSHD